MPLAVRHRPLHHPSANHCSCNQHGLVCVWETHMLIGTREGCGASFSFHCLVGGGNSERRAAQVRPRATHHMPVLVLQPHARHMRSSQLPLSALG